MKIKTIYRQYAWAHGDQWITLTENCRPDSPTVHLSTHGDPLLPSVQRFYATWDEAVAALQVMGAEKGFPLEALRAPTRRSATYLLDGAVSQNIEGVASQRHWWRVSCPMQDDLHGELSGYAPNWEEALTRSQKAVAPLLAALKNARG